MTDYAVGRTFPGGYLDTTGITADDYITDRGELTFRDEKGKQVATFAYGKWDSVADVTVIIPDKELIMLLAEESANE